MELVQKRTTPEELLNNDITTQSNTLRNSLITATLSELPIDSLYIDDEDKTVIDRIV